MQDRNIAGIGIDPGKSGALAVVTQDGLEVFDFLDIESAANDLQGLNTRFDIRFAILEKVWVRAGEADVKSAEVLIRNAAMWDTLLHALDIHHEEYAPATWRKGLVSRSRQCKEKYIKIARKYFPDYTFARHDQAEAALMAYRAWRHIMAGWATKKRVTKH